MPVEQALDLSSVIQRVPHVRFEVFDDELLAIDGESGFCYSLNEVAGRVWQAIETPAALRDVCLQLAPQYAVDPATFQQDVTELVHKLLEYGLLRVVASPA
ncbi:MAG: PqqD family protein [Anaerolineales bacterium]